MLLFVVDLIVFLSLAAQFAIAGYFLYLVYWLIELPPADSVLPPLPDELRTVIRQAAEHYDLIVEKKQLLAELHR